MPLDPQHELAPLFTAIAEGRVRLIAWGRIEWVPCWAWQCPLPLEYLVDNNPALWGTTWFGRPVHSPDRLDQEDPTGAVVIIYYYLGASYSALVARLDQAGLRYVVPGMLEQAFVSPASGQEAPSVLAGLRDLVAWSGGDDQDRIRRFMALAMTETRWQRLARLLEQRRRPPIDATGREGRVILLIEQLHPGGAERQLCELAVGLKRAGWEVAVGVLRLASGEGPARHYVDRLRSAGIECLAAELPETASALATMVGQAPDAALALWHLPPYLTFLSFAAVDLLNRFRPEILISYLDRPNVTAGVAGILSDVPRILLSGRNVHPGHFPHLFGRQPDDFVLLYRMVARLPGVTLSSNSTLAAASYADWIGVDRDQVTVVGNAVAEQTLYPVSVDAIAALRAQMAPPDRRIVLGVFRLSPEKQPDLFLRVLAKVAAVVPDIHGVICGDGPLRQTLLAQATTLGLADRLTVMGVIDAVPTAMRAADVLLHTARFEGMPNVLLEAQAVGLAVVCTDVGGSQEALAPELAGYSHPSDDFDGLVASVLRLLIDGDERRRLAEIGRRYILNNHSLPSLVERTLAAVGLCSDTVDVDEAEV